MKTLVIAPHPDDEVLGCGGTLLRRKLEGSQLGWLIVTGIAENYGWTTAQVAQREREIVRITEQLHFDQVYNLRLRPAELDTMSMATLIGLFSEALKSFQPEEMLIPHPSDAHSDHRIVFDAASACTKWFRYPSIRRVLAYETLSETDFNLDPDRTFRPNYFIDISQHLERKLELLETYQSELGKYPFPRSIPAIRALAAVRGAASGFDAAEAFQLLRERQ